jgi:hypothetical protein
MSPENQHISKKLQWPAILMFCLSIFILVNAVYYQIVEDYFLGLGFACFSYPSIRLSSADLFRRKSLNDGANDTNKKHQIVDGLVQFLGLVLVFIGVVVL